MGLWGGDLLWPKGIHDYFLAFDALGNVSTFFSNKLSPGGSGFDLQI